MVVTNHLLTGMILHLVDGRFIPFSNTEANQNCNTFHHLVGHFATFAFQFSLSFTGSHKGLKINKSTGMSCCYLG